LLFDQTVMFPRRKDDETVVLLGITALAIDGGFWYDLRNRMQGAGRHPGDVRRAVTDI